MTKLEKASRAYGDKVAHPEIRSMYPTISRSEMSYHLAVAYKAGAAFQRELSAKLLESQIDGSDVRDNDVNHFLSTAAKQIREQE